MVLTILIGDDSFAKGDKAHTAVSNMFTSMADAADYTEAFPISLKEEGGAYVGRNIVPYASEVRATCVVSVDDLLAEAQSNNYDMIITDLEYGDFGGDRGGVRVIDEINNSETLALCTSSSDRGLLEKLEQRVSLLAAPSMEKTWKGKFELLGEKISKFYR